MFSPGRVQRVNPHSRESYSIEICVLKFRPNIAFISTAKSLYTFHRIVWMCLIFFLFSSVFVFEIFKLAECIFGDFPVTLTHSVIHSLKYLMNVNFECLLTCACQWVTSKITIYMHLVYANLNVYSTSPIVHTYIISRSFMLHALPESKNLN